MRKHGFFCLCVIFLLAVASVAPAQEENYTTQPFDSFGALPSDDAGARMDNFALALQNQPEMDGYIICYGTEGDGSGAANFIFRSFTDYLVNTRAIERERIKTIYGGRYKKADEVLIELWIIPRAAPAPELKLFKSKIETISGKYKEYEAWDGYPDAGDGPPMGSVSFAAYADALKQQPNSVAYIVAFNKHESAPGTWRRVARRTTDDLREYGIEADRIKTIFGGTMKKKEDEGDTAQSAFIQLWILPKDAPPPVKEARRERTPKEAVEIGSYYSYFLKIPQEERFIFDGFADVFRSNHELNVCFVIHPLVKSVDKETAPDEPPDIEPLKIIEKWKAELAEKYGIKENRIFLLTAAPDESNSGMIEVWAVPLGAALPDPFAVNDEMAETDSPTRE